MGREGGATSPRTNADHRSWAGRDARGGQADRADGPRKNRHEAACDRRICRVKDADYPRNMQMPGQEWHGGVPGSRNVKAAGGLATQDALTPREEGRVRAFGITSLDAVQRIQDANGE